MTNDARDSPALVDLLPDAPVDGHEVVLWEVEPYWPDGVQRVRFVYHARAEWRDVFPDADRDGAPFEDQWMVYRGHDGDEAVGRIDGWRSVARLLEPPAPDRRHDHNQPKYATRRAALRVALDRARRDVALLERDVASLRDRERVIADALAAEEASP